MSEKAKEMQELVRGLVERLVVATSAVDVHARDEDSLVIVDVIVAESDLGRVVGKGGATARSLRIILRAAGVKTNTRVDLNISARGERAGK